MLHALAWRSSRLCGWPALWHVLRFLLVVEFAGAIRHANVEGGLLALLALLVNDVVDSGLHREPARPDVDSAQVLVINVVDLNRNTGGSGLPIDVLMMLARCCSNTSRSPRLGLRRLS